MISKEEKMLIINFLRTNVNASLIYLFGSFAQGIENANSDIDLAFMSSSIYSEKDIFFLSQELATNLNRDIDLIDFNKASEVLAFQILKTGIVLYDYKPSERAQLELTIMKKYSKLNEERAQILQDYLNGDTTHG